MIVLPVNYFYFAFPVSLHLRKWNSPRWQHFCHWSLLVASCDTKSMCGGRAGLPLIPYPSFHPSSVFTHGLSPRASGFPVILFTHCHLLCLLFLLLYFHINLCCICGYVKSIFAAFQWLRLQKLPFLSCCGIPTSFLSKKLLGWRQQLGHVLNLHPTCS